MSWFRPLVLVLAILSAVQPSLAILDVLEIDGETEQEGDDRVVAVQTECTAPAARQRRTRCDAATTPVAILPVPRPAPTLRSAVGLAAFRPAVPVPLLC